MTVVPGAEPHTLSLVCDTCGQAVDGIESTTEHWPVVWALISRQGWGGSPLAIGPHQCADCFGGGAGVQSQIRRGDDAWGVSMTEDPLACVVRLSGQLDILYAHELQEVLADAADRHRNVVLDLRDVRLLDSTGMGQLVRARQAADVRGGSLCLVGPSPFIVTVLETMRLAPEFRIFPDTSDALSWLKMRDAG
jgi:anti-anti-sigma factor